MRASTFLCAFCASELSRAEPRLQPAAWELSGWSLRRFHARRGPGICMEAHAFIPPLTLPVLQVHQVHITLADLQSRSARRRILVRGGSPRGRDEESAFEQARGPPELWLAGRRVCSASAGSKAGIGVDPAPKDRDFCGAHERAAARKDHPGMHGLGGTASMCNHMF